MIQMQTSLEVADNSGARRVEMIMPIGGSTGKIAALGDRIKVTVKEASPDGTIKKGTVQDAVIVRTRAGNHASMSAQMFCAHDSAYVPSSSFALSESPPAPLTGSIVFSVASYVWTDATCTTLRSSIKL